LAPDGDVARGRPDSKPWFELSRPPLAQRTPRSKADGDRTRRPGFQKGEVRSARDLQNGAAVTTIMVTCMTWTSSKSPSRSFVACEQTSEGEFLDEIDQQLRANPAMVTRRRKMLGGVIPPWDQVRPVWQLRVGDLRVFYDVDARGKRVTIRAVRRKVRKTTEGIL